MSEQDQQDRLEQRLRQDAAGLRYPPTPDFAGRGEPRFTAGWPLRWAVGVALILIASLAAQPVRAALFDFLQVGAVAIEVPGGTEATTAKATQTMALYLGDLYTLEGLSGASSLAEARELAGFEIALPTWPPAAGEPDRVFLQAMDPGRYFVILVWLMPDSEAIDYALYILGPGISITKGVPLALEEMTINSHQAAYVQGGHLLVVEGFHQAGVLVAGPALIWEGGNGLTYRLESERPLDELIRIAESMEQE